MSRFGNNPTAFAWNVSSGYQSDGDSGLKLLGHRYYDSRTGRFISQDPAGDGDNWYAYCDNDPTDATDPTGLVLEGSGPSPFESMAAGGAGTLAENQGFLGRDYTVTWREWKGHNGDWSNWWPEPGSAVWTEQGFMLPSDRMNQMAMPRWKQLLQAGLGTIAAGLAIGQGVKNPTPQVKVPRAVVEEAKPGKTVEEEEKDKGAGSKFALHKPSLYNLRTNLALTGQALLNGLNNIADSWARGTHGGGGYGGLAPLGGGVEVAP